MTHGTIVSTGEFTVRSFGNGWAYEIEDKYGNTVWLQDEDAARFGEALDGTNDIYTDADACAEYF